jgi:hypothetical protein
MLAGETVAVYFENHKNLTNTLCLAECMVWCAEAGDTVHNHWDLKG